MVSISSSLEAATGRTLAVVPSAYSTKTSRKPLMSMFSTDLVVEQELQAAGTEQPRLERIDQILARFPRQATAPASASAGLIVPDDALDESLAVLVGILTRQHRQVPRAATHDVGLPVPPQLGLQPLQQLVVQVPHVALPTASTRVREVSGPAEQPSQFGRHVAGRAQQRCAGQAAGRVLRPTPACRQPADRRPRTLRHDEGPGRRLSKNATQVVHVRTTIAVDRDQNRKEPPRPAASWCQLGSQPVQPIPKPDHRSWVGPSHDDHHVRHRCYRHQARTRVQAAQVDKHRSLRCGQCRPEGFPLDNPRRLLGGQLPQIPTHLR